MQKRVSTLTGIIIIVVAIVVLFGGVFAYQYFVLLKQLKAISSTPPGLSKQQILNKPFPLAGEPTDQTAGWQTYTNTQYGFEIKYPSTAKIEETGEYDIESFTVIDETKKLDPNNNLSFLSPRQFEVSIHPPSLSESQYNFELSNGVVPGSISNIKVDGKDAVMLKDVWNYEENSYYGYNILIKYNSMLYTLNYWMDDQKLNNIGNYAISQQILSTFKFTK